MKSLMKSVEQQSSFDLVIEIAEYIAIHMEKYHISKTEMAKTFNISRMYLHQILTGKRTPTLDMIVNIARMLDKKVQIKFVNRGK